MNRLRTAPTKSALLNLRKQVEFLEGGHALLERKRELLTRLVYQHIKEYQEKKEKDQGSTSSSSDSKDSKSSESKSSESKSSESKSSESKSSEKAKKSA